MNLPRDFQFSQSSLQDYVDCKRRFLNRHVLDLAWPAVEAEPPGEHENLMRLGRELHQVIQRHITGVPEERLTPLLKDERLLQWWQNYLRFPPPDLPDLRFAEVSLSAPLAGYRLIAKFDLLALKPEKRGVIVDWKATARPPSRSKLQDRLQTRVYPYSLVRAGRALSFGWAIQPTQVEMMYWFADDPQQPQLFEYSESSYSQDEKILTGLIEEIENLNEAAFERTTDERNCRFCFYRSLCDRGIRAGSFHEDWLDKEGEDISDFDLDFDQIAEIEF